MLKHFFPINSSVWLHIFRVFQLFFCSYRNLSTTWNSFHSIECVIKLFGFLTHSTNICRFILCDLYSILSYMQDVKYSIIKIFLLIFHYSKNFTSDLMNEESYANGKLRTQSMLTFIKIICNTSWVTIHFPKYT